MKKQQPSLREMLRSLSDSYLVLMLPLAEAGEKRKVAFELGRRRANEALDPLRRLLDSEDPTVRAAAAEALGKIGDNAAGPDLLALFRKSGEPDYVRDTCAYALARLAYGPALPALISALSDPSPTVRICVVAALLSLDIASVYDRVALARNTEQNAEVLTAMGTFLKTARRPKAVQVSSMEEPKNQDVEDMQLTNPPSMQIVISTWWPSSGEPKEVYQPFPARAAA